MSSFVALQRATLMLRHWLPFSGKPGAAVARRESTRMADASVPDTTRPRDDDAKVVESEDELELCYQTPTYTDDEDVMLEEEIVLTPLDRLVKPSKQRHVERVPEDGALLPRQLPHDQGRLTVVLDMDETLLHALVEPISMMDQQVPEHMGKQDFECGFKYADEWFQAKVWKRPGLARFLRELSKFCEPVIFTAGSRDYAEPVLDTVDTEGTLRSRLYRDAVVSYPAGGSSGYVKDLSMLGRDLSRTLIIDNTPRVFALHPWNGIVIRDYHGDDPHCTALDQLLELLRHFAANPDTDVRDMIRDLPVFNNARAYGRVPDHGVML